jgi:hypothetical protein
MDTKRFIMQDPVVDAISLFSSSLLLLTSKLECFSADKTKYLFLARLTAWVGSRLCMQILDVVESVCEEQILYMTGASMTKKKKFCNIDTWVTTVFFLRT